jgi:hypothetical protein
MFRPYRSYVIKQLCDQVNERPKYPQVVVIDTLICHPLHPKVRKRKRSKVGS